MKFYLGHICLSTLPVTYMLPTFDTYVCCAKDVVVYIRFSTKMGGTEGKNEYHVHIDIFPPHQPSLIAGFPKHSPAHLQLYLHWLFTSSALSSRQRRRRNYFSPPSIRRWPTFTTVFVADYCLSIRPRSPTSTSAKMSDNRPSPSSVSTLIYNPSCLNTSSFPASFGQNIISRPAASLSTF